MIKPTRITVDHATREVLDQLSTQLAQAPAWAITLGDRIQDDVRDASQQAHTATNRRLDSLVEASRVLQGQIVEQKAGVTELLNIVRVLEERFSERERGMLEAMHQLLHAAEQRQRDDQVKPMQVLAAVSASIQSLETRVAVQHGALELQRNDLTTLLNSREQEQAAVSKHQSMLEAMQHLLRDAVLEAQKRESSRVDAQAQAQAATLALLRQVQTEQTRQQKDLQLVCQRLDEMSRPWWKKLFNRNRSQNS